MENDHLFPQIFFFCSPCGIFKKKKNLRGRSISQLSSRTEMEDSTLIHKSRTAAVKKERRDGLRGKVDDAAKAIDEERRRREALSAKSAELRAKVDRLSRMSEELLAQRDRYDAHVRAEAAQFARRHEALGSSGLLTFSRDCGDEKPGRTIPGCHCRRTAYATKYDNTRVLGPCERLLTLQRSRRVETAMDAAEARPASGASLPPVHGSSAAGSAQAGNDPTRRRPTAGPWQGEQTARIVQDKLVRSASTVPNDRRDAVRAVQSRSVLHQMNYHGMPSLYLQDLEQKRGHSLRRTRHYTDFMGRLISMDPCDWPSHNEFVLIGL